MYRPRCEQTSDLTSQNKADTHVNISYTVEAPLWLFTLKKACGSNTYLVYKAQMRIGPAVKI